MIREDEYPPQRERYDVDMPMQRLGAWFFPTCDDVEWLTALNWGAGSPCNEFHTGLVTEVADPPRLSRQERYIPKTPWSRWNRHPLGWY